MVCILFYLFFLFFIFYFFFFFIFFIYYYFFVFFNLILFVILKEYAHKDSKTLKNKVIREINILQPFYL